MDQERDQVREVEDARRRVAEDVRNVAENANVVDRAKETVDDRMQQMRENPIGMLIAGAAVGVLIGLVLPVSRSESKRMGPITREAGSEVVRRGGEVIKETISATKVSGAG
ncbi:MAG TPA: hypothetical protein VKT72_00740 [Candidatus Baltobacteraceae bacterium]|nr:hypothetical protein [Candidatus Baltobacteraceae bacterium]